MTLYTYETAAAALGLTGTRRRAAIYKRIQSLAAQGCPLTVEAGELVEAGPRKLITETGLERLRAFTPRKPGPKSKKPALD